MPASPTIQNGWPSPQSQSGSRSSCPAWSVAPIATPSVPQASSPCGEDGRANAVRRVTQNIAYAVATYAER